MTISQLLALAAVCLLLFSTSTSLFGSAGDTSTLKKKPKPNPKEFVVGQWRQKTNVWPAHLCLCLMTVFVLVAILWICLGSFPKIYIRL